MATDAAACDTQNPVATKSAAHLLQPRASWLLMTVGLAILALTLLAGYGYARFGSLYTARAYLHGDRLFLDQPTKSVRALRPGKKRTVAFTLTNMSTGKITILGANSSCTCTVAENLPLELPAGQNRALEIAFHDVGKPGEFSETVVLYTDYPQQPRLAVQLTGQVVER